MTRLSYFGGPGGIRTHGGTYVHRIKSPSPSANSGHRSIVIKESLITASKNLPRSSLTTTLIRVLLVTEAAVYALDARLGIEPRLAGSEPVFLPLEDRASNKMWEGFGYTLNSRRRYRLPRLNLTPTWLGSVCFYLPSPASRSATTACESSYILFGRMTFLAPLLQSVDCKLGADRRIRTDDGRVETYCLSSWLYPQNLLYHILVSFFLTASKENINILDIINIIEADTGTFASTCLYVA